MEKFKILAVRRAFLSVMIIMAVSLASSPTVEAENISPDADRLLQSMSVYLAGIKAFSLNADIDFEIIDLNGQKLQFSSLASLVLERPAKFHATRKGLIADAEFNFDGEILTLYGKNINAFAQEKVVPGTIDNAILAYEAMTGLSAPAADLLFADPYKVLSSGVKSGAYIGIAYVNGVECHHLAFRKAEVDWQIWITTGDEPLPVKYIISNKWVTGSPQYEIRLRDWNTSPEITKDQFAFTRPDGARNLETMSVNELGEFIATEEGQ